MTDITPRDIARRWPLTPLLRVQPVEQGTNNRSFIVTANEGRFFLKTYRNQMAGDRLAFEHALLRALDALHLPFAVPVPIASRAGATIVELDADGERWLAALSAVILGHSARFDNVSETMNCGEALAILTEALGAIRLPSDVPVPPTYGDLVNVHPMVTDPAEAIRHHLRDTSMADELVAVMSATEDEWARRTAGWTEQIIHSDFYPANVMVRDGRVSGVLDFEFAGLGYRAMDFATGLMAFGLKRQDERGQALAAMFANGYLQRLPLSADELAAVPMLLRMRELTSLLHWLGRMQQGLTTPVDIEERAHRAIELHRRLDRIGEELIHRLGAVRDV